MNTLADSWIVWLVISGTIAGLMVFYRDSKRSGPASTAFASQDEFSIKTILFGFKRGEGDLFLGYMGSMIFFALFLAGFVRWIQRMV